MGHPDPRPRRTRDAILGAFTALVLTRRYDALRTADLIAAADIGRSTFYEHFPSKEAVLLAAVEPILRTLASAALGRASKAQVRAMLEHVWEQRGFARMLLDGRTGANLQRQLAALIAERLDTGTDATMVATAAAAAQLAMLRLWIGGAVPCTPAELALRMLACAALVSASGSASPRSGSLPPRSPAPTSPAP
ncbi:TetR/AcrR family transcriptional regulator [Sphingomonas sp. HF-S4]|uniref:TetR/AcrR family transcriptional regulator n=1 Tax=Sphingomonas agrestis TaxID=3080540 RepID=A0ABU3YBU6_9SPHN|nr:TetR/AcrR family transcriptional regulator [Sphingomonas sp. HF-S4]MDV3458869.1 TetR/AcrR family transcriptional regulator [Sphingomonas sp. HF-S4]